MGFFNALKSYEHEINEIRQYLDLEKNMRPEYSGPFIAAYGKKMGALIENGRKKAVSFNTSSEEGAHANRIFAQNAIRFSVLGQAIRAYMTDLRSEKYAKTAVETAIWGIILDEEPDLIDSMKPGLSDFVLNNFERMVPSARSVFTANQPEPRMKADARQESCLSRKSDLKINPSGTDQKRVFSTLNSMLGDENTYRALELLSYNDLVVKSIGKTLSQMKLNSRLEVTLGWLTNVVRSESIWENMLFAENFANVDYNSRTSSVGKSSFSVNDVSGLIKDVKNKLDVSGELSSKPAGTYWNYLASKNNGNPGNDANPNAAIRGGTESTISYRKEFETHLNETLRQALETEDSAYVDLVSTTLWSRDARACGAKAGAEVGLHPKDAAILTAFIIGQNYEQIFGKNGKSSMTEEIKWTYKHHLKVASYLNKYIKRLKSTGLSERFLQIFMEEIDITTLYSG